MPTLNLIPLPELPPTRLRETREARDLSRTRAAAAIGVDASSIHRWEAGSPVPDLRKLQLATLYGVAPAWLIGWTDDDTGPPAAASLAGTAAA